MTQQRILIVIEDGAFKGASSTNESGRPIPLDLDALGIVLPGLNAAALAEIERIMAAHALELAAAQGQPRPDGGVTKLTIKRRLDALGAGKWATLKGILASLPDDAQDEWTLAQEIRADDPLFLHYADTLKGMLELTDEQFAGLLVP
jgi:hypothetical protein